MESRTKPWEGSATQLAKELQTYGLEEPADPRAVQCSLAKTSFGVAQWLWYQSGVPPSPERCPPDPALEGSLVFASLPSTSVTR